MKARDLTSFIILCAIWGTTWIGIKAGVDSVQPLLFGGSRFLAAGILLTVFVLGTGRWKRLAPRQWLRLIGASMLMIPLCYGPLFVGMQHLNSGTAAVIEMSLTPLALLVFGVALKEEAWTTSRAVAVLLGAVGLLLLFINDLRLAVDWVTAISLAAVAWAAVSSAWGSVLARPLLRSVGPVVVAGSSTLIGGAAMCVLSVAFEESGSPTHWPPSAVAGWLYLVVFGSLVGYTLYMRLLRDVGPTGAGSFAFVSPIVAVLIGALFAGESVGWISILGMSLMLMAAYLALRGTVGRTKSRGEISTCQPVMPRKEQMSNVSEGAARTCSSQMH